MKLLSPRTGERRVVSTRDGKVDLHELLRASSLGGSLRKLVGASVILMGGDQVKTAACLIELDGVARRIVLCPPDLQPKHLKTIVRDAESDTLVYDGGKPIPANIGVAHLASCVFPLTPQEPIVRPFATEWILLTSGTVGDPKMVVHTLASLTDAILNENSSTVIRNWATFYDIRRYGGLQIFLRAIADRGSLTLHEPDEIVDDFLARAAAEHFSHISGTPSHWRLALMNSTAARRIDPKYVRLSGEIADRSVLDALRATYLRAAVVHAYASTEAGLGFEVTDGEPGFPAEWLESGPDNVTIKVIDGSLRIRSNRTALRYLNDCAKPLLDSEGFIDTGDIVSVQGDRCYFVGRRDGIINVGGSKVNPEEVETVINRHPAVRASLVKGRRNPVTGAVVVADVELEEGTVESIELKREIIAACAAEFPIYKVPVIVNVVASLDVTAGGKLNRR